MKTVINFPGFSADASLLKVGKHQLEYQFENKKNRIIPMRSCSSRDGNNDCFCNKGCRRGRSTCDCPND
jgi:hypothetical protein